MTKKQRDLRKLKAYAKALGLKVVFKKATRTTPGASWGTDLVITFYMRKKTSQKLLILNMIHEFGHHRQFIEDGKIHDDMLYDALNTEDSRIGKRTAQVDKSMRALILEDETRAASFRQEVRKQLDLESVTEKQLDKDIKLDLWVYTYYYQKGEFPTMREVQVAKRRINK